MGAVYEPSTYVESVYEETAYNPVTEDYEPGYAGFGIYASGDAVSRLQAWLNRVILRHASQKLKVDGLYGPQTTQAVRTLQHFLNLTKRAGLKEDGLYGCRTYRAVLRYYKELGWTPPPPPIPKWATGCENVAQQPVVNKKPPKTHPTIVVKPTRDDKIFGIDKKIVYIGGAVLIGALIIMMLNKER